MASRPRLVCTLLLLALLAACTRETPPDGAAGSADPDSTAANAIPGRVFERAVVFLTSVGDSTMIVPWLFAARTKPGGVDRVARAWLDRGGEWEPFLDQSWETTPTRAPWRLLPRGPLHLMVGQGEVLETIAFEEGPRRLEVEMAGIRSEWSGTQGETWVVADGAAVLSDRRLPGLVLDLARAHRGDAAPAGDWMFLASGDSVVMVLSGSGMTPGERGVFDRKLLDAAIARMRVRSIPEGKTLEDMAKKPLVCIIDYRDGLRACLFTLDGAIEEWTAAWKDDSDKITSLAFMLQEERPYSHFAVLLNGIEQMMHSGRATWPVERTLLTSGIVDFALQSQQAGGTRVETPQLDVKYESNWNWTMPISPPPERPRGIQ